jgi:hypothetical protein
MASGIACVWDIDKPLNFLSFFGAVITLTGIYKINKGERQRRIILTKEQQQREFDELKRQQEEL